MYTRKSKNREQLIAAAMQKIPCDLTITNIKLVNVITGEIYPASVDILDGFIVRIREQNETTAMKSTQVYDGGGAYLAPGFIDTHMHVESSMMIPENLSRAAVPWGTTTVCTDPHEVANVMGIDGVRFMLENAKKSKLRQYVLAPSCIPAVPGLESSGASFGVSEITQILNMPNVLGIAELMDFVGVYSASDRMSGIIDEGLRRNVFLQGHAPKLSGKELTAYLLAGPISDHESCSGEEAAEKLRMGMHVNIRANSLVDHLSHVMSAIKNHGWRDFVSVCTDDIHASDLLREGHINKAVAKVIATGIMPIEAYKLATLNAAREYNFTDLGAIAPGYLADVQLVDELDGRRPRAVFINGQLVAENGSYIGTDDNVSHLSNFPNTVNIPQITSIEDFRLKAPANQNDFVDIHVVEAIDESRTLNRAIIIKLPIVNGFVSLDNRQDLQYVCICNRYGNNNRTIAVFKDFGLQCGAIATTISHDSHNLTIVYKKPEDAYVAALALRECGGGIAIVKDAEILKLLPLPIAGLMSPLSCEEVAKEVAIAQKAVNEVCYMSTIVLQTSVISLPCLPGVVITDKGIVDGINQTFLPLFPSLDN